MYDKYKLALLKGNYIKTKAAYERIKNQVESIGQHILEEHLMYSVDEPEQRITRAFDTYMLNESDFTAYLVMLYTEEQKAGIAHPNGMGYCADGPAKQAYIDAEKALIQYGLDIIPEHMADTKETLQERIFKPEVRQGALDLIMKLA